MTLLPSDFILWAIFFVLFSLLYTVLRIHSSLRQIQRLEENALELYYHKINKIPAMIEIVKQYTPYDDIFLELIRLHKTAMISSVDNIYDILENNHRVYREFQFLMKVCTKIRDLHTDGNFLYVRDFIIFYETHLNKEIEKINREIALYNRYLVKKNFTIFGILFPYGQKLPIVM